MTPRTFFSLEAQQLIAADVSDSRTVGQWWESNIQKLVGEHFSLDFIFREICKNFGWNLARFFGPTKYRAPHNYYISNSKKQFTRYLYLRLQP